VRDRLGSISAAVLTERRTERAGKMGERVARRQAPQTTVLLMDTEPGRRRAVAAHLMGDDCAVVPCASTAQILDELRRGDAAVVVIGCTSPAPALFADLPAIHAVDRRRPIVLCRQSTPSIAVARSCC
jgi:DNA-binding NtrC family response regulator